MNNGIHYYDQLKSNITQSIPMLLISLETVESNAALLQLISYPTTEAINKGVFISYKEKVCLCSLIGGIKAILLHIQKIFVLAHFTSMMQKSANLSCML